MARGVIDDVLDGIMADQANVVYGRVLTPTEKTEFGYGYLSGYAAALAKVEMLIQAALEKEKRRV